MENAQVERTNEKREITPDKPILFRLIGLRDSAPVKPPQGGKETPMVNFVLVVDDRKYPQFDGDRVMHRVNAWCCSGTNGGRKTKSYEFFETVLGEGEALAYDRIDLGKCLTPAPEGQKPAVQQPEELQELWGRYVVGWMKPAEQDDKGRWWQNPKEFKHPSALDLDADERRMDQETMRQFLLSHMPIPVIKPEPQPEPKVQAPKHEPPELIEAVVDKLKDFVSKGNGYGTLAKAFLALNGKDRVMALDEQGLRHLKALMQLQQHANNGGPAGQQVVDYLKTKNCGLHQLSAADTIFLLTSADKTASDGVTF